MSVPSASTHRAALDAFARALRRETHQLARQPELLWPVLYNRLRWEDEPSVAAALAPEVARRTQPDAAPWLRLRTGLEESPALIRTLAAPGHAVDLCAFSPNGGTLLATSKYDRRPKLWEVASGQVRLTLPDTGDGTIEACAFSPDGASVFVATSVYV